MFSWICPKCGTEVPPSQSECPRCQPQAQAPAYPPPAQPVPMQYQTAPPQPMAAPAPLPPPEARRPPKQGGILFSETAAPSYPPPPPAYQPPPGYAAQPQQPYPAPPQQQYQTQPPQQAYAPPPPQYQQPYQPPYAAPPAPSQGMPTWLIMILVAVGVGGLIAGLVYFKSRSSQPASAQKKLELAPGSAESAADASPASARYAKILEVTGFRLSEERQKAQLKMLVVNHSAAQIGSVKLKVTLTSTDGKELGTANVDVNGIDPQSSVDLSAPLKTSLRTYELPDWQFVRAQFSVIER